MFLYFISFLLLFQATEVPYRDKDDFQIELKYDFKDKPASDPNTVRFDDPNNKKKERHSGPLPYLVVKLKILNHKEEETRFRCENNLGRALFNKKAEKSLDYDIDMGYIDDVKDRITAHSFIVYALTEKREAVNKIELLVMEDGTFLVNGEKRGKF